jgi:hypothetical protein
MSSQKRIEANRANSKHSTGPVTPEGKAKASRNATRHGLLSKVVVLRTEDRAEFILFRDGLVADLRPEGDLEDTLAERVAGQWWRLKRVGRMESMLMEHDLGAWEEVGERGERGLYPPVAGGDCPLSVAEGGQSLAADGEVQSPSPQSPSPQSPSRAMVAALAETLGRQFCPYETLRRYERAIERGLDGTMRQFREAQKLRGLREATVRDDSYRSQYERGRQERLDAKNTSDEAIEELLEVRQKARRAGVDVGRSALLEKVKRDWSLIEEEVDGRPLTAAGPESPSARAPAAPAEASAAAASADESEFRRHGREKGQ